MVPNKKFLRFFLTLYSRLKVDKFLQFLGGPRVLGVLTEPKNEKNIFVQIVYKFVIAEFSEKVKFKSLASNAKKL